MPSSTDSKGKPQTPAALGYRMPAEWEPHAATWLSWPRPDGISFPGGGYARAVPALVKMVGALAGIEAVHINVGSVEQEAEVRRHLDALPGGYGHVRFLHIPTNEPWCRDHGAIFLTRAVDPKLAVLDFDYNAWGWKYPPSIWMTRCRRASPRLWAGCRASPRHRAGRRLHRRERRGHAADHRELLAQPEPQPQPEEIADRGGHQGLPLRRNILWLGDGIEGDDTDGHIDDLTRFVDRSTVVTVVEEDEHDANYEPLQTNLRRLREMSVEDGTPLRVLTLPMPSKIVRDGQRLPASYANFYVGNTVVLLPTFNDPHDAWAASVLKQAFPGRKIVSIDSCELIWGLGAFHCLTQQCRSCDEQIKKFCHPER